MADELHRQLLARIDATLERDGRRLRAQRAPLPRAFHRMDERNRSADERDALAAERHEALMLEHRRLAVPRNRGF